KLFKQAAALVVPCESLRKQVVTLGATPQKVHVNSYGVDINEFDQADPEHAPPVFVSVGQLIDANAPQLTLLAMRKVVDAIPDAKLMVIGDGPLRQSCSDLLKTLKLSDSVDLQGRHLLERVAKRMRGA